MPQDLCKQEERAVFRLRELYRRYGYMPYKMSRFEEYDLYSRNKDFLVSGQVITFTDGAGRLLALKPDVTMSIVKNAPEEPGVVRKVYYNENVYRDFREILQAGLECVGDLGDYELGETMHLAMESLSLLGERYLLCVSHMGLVEAMLLDCGLTGEAQERAMDCLRQKNRHELLELGRTPQARRKLEGLLTSRTLEQLDACLTAPPERQALEELRRVWRALDPGDRGEHLRLDCSVTGAMGYYSGVVFRGFLEGVPTGILSGGQYDKLARKMGKRCRAIGFAIYLDRLPEAAGDGGLDVDTLILHDGTVAAEILCQTAQTLAREGSVLVARRRPADRRWKRLVAFEKGERVL